MTRTIAFLLGLPDMSQSQLIVALIIVVGAALALAWVADLLLADGAVGVIGNAVTRLLGAAAGLWLWRKFAVTLAFNPAAVTASVALAAGLAALLLVGVLRRYV